MQQIQKHYILVQMRLDSDRNGLVLNGQQEQSVAYAGTILRKDRELLRYLNAHGCSRGSLRHIGPVLYALSKPTSNHQMLDVIPTAYEDESSFVVPFEFINATLHSVRNVINLSPFKSKVLGVAPQIASLMLAEYEYFRTEAQGATQ